MGALSGAVSVPLSSKVHDVAWVIAVLLTALIGFFLGVPPWFWFVSAMGSLWVLVRLGKDPWC